MPDFPLSDLEKARKLIDKVPDVELRREAERSLGDTASPISMVAVFHRFYNMPIVQPTASSALMTHIDGQRLLMRFNLVLEEFVELADEMGIEVRIPEHPFEEHAMSMVGIADAIGDLIYVLIGFCLETGIPIHAVLRSIQASNLSKLGADGKPIVREDGKVLKGPGYFKPDIRKVLRAHGVKDIDEEERLAGEGIGSLEQPKNLVEFYRNHKTPE